MGFKQTLAEAPAPSPAAPTISGSRMSTRVGPSLQIRGEITGTEDLQIDGIVEGPIFLKGHELIVGATAQLKSEIHAGDVVIRGKVAGNVDSRGRVEITKEGSLTGDIACARISIEDGAHFKGSIEINPEKSRVGG